VGLATVNAFLEATAKVSTASATAAATARETSAEDEAAAIRAIRESMLALAVSRGDSGSADADASVDETSPPKSTSFRSGDAGDSGVRLAESRVEPGAPVVFRTREAREASPERLDLDRMGLRECCLLEGEHRLRLLNYQGNRIARVSRLGSVRNLVFLDLTENALESLEGVEACPHLRVLLVGKNNLRTLGRALASLPKLDVLDARENGIDAVGDAAVVFGAAAASVRVLNLAGNALRETGDLRGLRNVHELDLRRNRIARLPESCLPESLRRCFLSANPLASRDALAPLASLPRLEALALDGTPWRAGAGNPGRACRPDERDRDDRDDRDDDSFSRANYRAATASIAPHLRTLDGEDVTDEERRAALCFLVPDEREATRENEATRIRRATDSKRDVDDESSRRSGFPPTPTADTAPLTTLAFERGTARVRDPAGDVSGATRAPLATRGVPRAGDSRRFETPLGVAFDAATRSLTVRGRVETEATLRDHPGASLARRVVFAEGVFPGAARTRTDSGSDATRLKELVRLLRWARGASPRATALEFEDRGMGTLALVDAVARAGWRAESSPKKAESSPKKHAPGLESLRVAAARGAFGKTFGKASPSVFFRSYAIRTFPTLQFVDDVAVTPEARARAAGAFAGLEDATAYCARREDASPDAAFAAADGTSLSADGTTAYVDGVVAHASEVAEKLRALDACWDDVVRSYVAEGLGDEG
jgi:leucine-rich repeat-containing protein 49